MKPIAEWVILGIAVLLIISGIIWIRQRYAQGGINYGVLASNALYVIVTMAVVVFHIPPLHLLWLFPLAFVAGFLTLVPPFSWILMPLAKVYGTVCCSGVKPKPVTWRAP